jgi:hypothetical protein
MPDKETIKKANRALRSGKRASTAAGEFVREEIHHVRQGKHGARSAKQAIAIGLSKARRAGVPLPPPKAGSRKTRAAARRENAAGRKHPAKAPSPKRSRATKAALGREPRKAASHRALSRQAHDAAARRTGAERSAAARKAAATKRPARRKAATRKRRSGS